MMVFVCLSFDRNTRTSFKWCPVSRFGEFSISTSCLLLIPPHSSHPFALPRTHPTRLPTRARILVIVARTDDEDDSTDEETEDSGLSSGMVLGIVIVPGVLGALSFLVGAIFAFKAVRNWQHSGAADAMLPV